MAAEAAANPIPSADLRSILFIAFLPRLRNEPPQKRRAHFRGEWWCETEKRVGLLSKRACLPMAPVLVIAPNGEFGTSRFKGNYILRDLTRLRNSWFRPKTRLACVRRRRLRLLGMSGVGPSQTSQGIHIPPACTCLADVPEIG